MQDPSQSANIPERFTREKVLEAPSTKTQQKGRRFPHAYISAGFRYGINWTLAQVSSQKIPSSHFWLQAFSDKRTLAPTGGCRCGYDILGSEMPDDWSAAEGSCFRGSKRSNTSRHLQSLRSGCCFWEWAVKYLRYFWRTDLTPYGQISAPFPGVVLTAKARQAVAQQAVAQHTLRFNHPDSIGSLPEE